MKRWILLIFLIVSSQVSGYQTTDRTILFFADFLKWKMREGSCENWAQEITSAGAERTATILNAPFKWNNGLRFGVGTNLPYDHWDLNFYYTWFQSTAFSQASANSGGIYSPYLGNFYVSNTAGNGFGPNYRNASLQWKFLFNNLDLELGRKFIINPMLSLRPFIGLKGANIKQNINTFWQNPNPDTFFFIPITLDFSSATEHVENNFWGLGPSIGLNTTWDIYTNAKNIFAIFGNFSGALMWGHWSFKDQYQNNNNRTVNINVSNVNGGCSMGRALLGIEWSRSFTKTNIQIRIGYEAQVWFDQVQYYNFNMGRLENLMSLQGGLAGISVIF